MKLNGWQIRNKHKRSSHFILVNHENDYGVNRGVSFKIERFYLIGKYTLANSNSKFKIGESYKIN